MVLNPVSNAAKIVVDIINTTNQIQEDHIPGDVDQSIVLTPIDTMSLQTTVTISKNYYSSTAFILDHPVYGELDSSTLELDGDYLAGSTGIVHDTYTG